jgi:hypothetical protein
MQARSALSATMPRKRALRNLRVQSDYIEWMSSVFPALRSLEADDCQRLLWLVMDHDAEWRRHHANPQYFIIPSEERERLFNKRFDELYDQSGLFQRGLSFDFRRGQAAGFSLSLLAQLAHDEYLNADPDLAPVDWFAGDGTIGRSLPATIASRDIDGDQVKVWRGTELPNAVQIDVDALQHRIIEYRALIPTLVSSKDKAHALRRLRQCVRALRESHTTATDPGFLPHHYREVSTGRLAAIGLNGQSMAREVRAVAFGGYYDYDIENCHFAITAQICEKFGIPHDRIKEYIGDKLAFRDPISARYLLTDDEVKKCILARLYGATDSLYYRSAIPSLIGVAETKQLLADPWFAALSDEIECIMAAVIDAWGLGAGGLIINEARKGIAPTENPAKIFAHILQGVEGKMLSAVCRAFPTDIVVPVHDGFISRSRLDARQIEQIIKSNTGYDMRIAERILGPTDVREHYKVLSTDDALKSAESQAQNNPLDLRWRNKDGDLVELSSPEAGALPVGSGVTLRKLKEASDEARRNADRSDVPGTAKAA